MSADEEWGEWQIHDGKGCPCVGAVVHVVMGDDPDGVSPSYDDGGCWLDLIEEIAPDEAIVIARQNGAWTWSDGWFAIIRYRIRKPRALIELIEMVENLPAPQPGKVDA